MCVKSRTVSVSVTLKLKSYQNQQPNWQWYGSNVQLQKRFSLNGGDHHAYIYIHSLKITYEH